VQPAPNESTLDEDGLAIKRYAMHRYITRANLEREERLTHEEAYGLTPEDDPLRLQIHARYLHERSSPFSGNDHR